MSPLPPVSGLILSGGQGVRMGRRDKGLQPVDGRPVIVRVIGRLQPQVSEIIISANRNLAEYAAFGHPVVCDRLGAGPLAGLHAGLEAARHDLVAVAPCDAPDLPADLVVRLAAALGDTPAPAAVAATGDRIQPVFALVRKSALPRLAAYLAEGGRKAHAWFGNDAITVPFDDEAAAFANLNTPEDFLRFAHGAQ
jgi:molybdopterin-guanine dinucleotide biosynthesis protein A